MHDISTLDAYLGTYGKLLARQAEHALRPLHVPGRDPLLVAPLLRQPFPAQQHVISAGSKALKRQRSLLVIGEMGTGKTLMGMGIVHTHAKGKPYRALIFCPGQLLKKWEREIKETIPGACIVQLDGWKDVARLRRTPISGPTWYIIARDRAKLGSKWRPAWVQRAGEEFLRCPRCGQRLIKRRDDKATEADDAGQDGLSMTLEDLKKKRLTCTYPTGKSRMCDEPLWQLTSELKRFEPARYIHKRLKGFFDYFVCDEAHEEKSADSAQANALGSLAASAKKVLALTGTLIGGYAEHIRPLLMRLAPTSLVDEGFGWRAQMAFSEEYGRIETKITEREGGREEEGVSNSQSRGKSRSTSKYLRPGIMPTLFGRHLMQNSVFLGLDEVAANLPSLEEIVQGVHMDGEIAGAYKTIDEEMGAVIRDMVRRGDRRFLGAMLQTLLAYPDHPFGWDKVGYYSDDKFIPVVEPANFAPQIVRPKEQALLDIIKAEHGQGRQVWVFTTMTGEKDVADRIYQLVRKQKLPVEILRSTVELKKREEWIAKHGPKNAVIISHPKLVETGLDLFDKGGAHNFSTLVFFQTGFNLFTLRQASRRAWRIGQRLPCRVYYLYYEHTMQARAMALMGKKMAAAHAVEGRFSSDGLVAMGGDDGVEMALAKSLADQIDEGSATRAWQKCGTKDQNTGRDMDILDFASEMADVEDLLRDLPVMVAV